MPKVIVSAAGHGGTSPGAVHAPYVEKDLNLLVDAAFAKALHAKYTGFVHRRARERDMNVTLAQRVSVAKAQQTDCFLEFHFNAGGGTGPETYVANSATQDDLRLAGNVQEFLFGYLKKFGVRDRGVKKADFYVLRETRGIPSVLVEILFLDNATDREVIEFPGVIDKIGEALADGVAAFLRLEKKQSAECDCERIKDLLSYYHDFHTAIKNVLKMYP